MGGEGAVHINTVVDTVTWHWKVLAVEEEVVHGVFGW